VRLVDWTGWSAARIDGFGPRWREVATRDLVMRGVGADMTAPLRRSALTAKFAVGGRELYRVGPGGEALCADDDRWVVIGDDEPYSSRIPSGPRVATVGVFFDPDTVAAARGERGTAEPRLLDDPRGDLTREPLPIGRRLVPYDAALAAAVRALAVDDDADARDELHALALDRILAAARTAAAERDRLPCVRASTRAELHRRLARAHDRIMSAYAEPLELRELARLAAMAPHHFLRRFRDVFGATPHRVLTARRVERASHLLAHSDAPIASIARAVGFATPASFAARFHRETGRSPRAFRRRPRPRIDDTR
jgi:AraC-like DNA-binding protein